jgi:hypothetical protein
MTLCVVFVVFILRGISSIYDVQLLDRGVVRETHTKRQATQHGCLPNLLGDGDKGIEIVYSEEKNILYRIAEYCN